MIAVLFLIVLLVVSVAAVLFGGGSIAQLPLAQIAVLIGLFCIFLPQASISPRHSASSASSRASRFPSGRSGTSSASQMVWGPTTNFVLVAVPQALARFVSGLPVPPWVIMALIIGFYLALGTFMEGFSMIVTTTP